MEYKLQILKLKKFLLIMLPCVIISFFAGFLLFVIYFNNFYLIPLAFPTPILLFRLLQIKLSEKTVFTFKKEGIIIGTRMFAYELIDGYNWDSNITMDALSIKMKDGETNRFTISKLDRPKENYKNFVKTFSSTMEKNHEIRPHLRYSEIHETEVKFMKPIFWILSVVILVLFGFSLFKGLEISGRLYFLPIIMVLFYLKIFR